MLIPTLRKAAAIVPLCLVTSPLLAADGILIVQKETTGGKTQTHQVQIERTRMRAESTGPDGGQQVFVFDGPAQVMRVIDYAKKTYLEMTRADADRLGAQISGAMAQMEEQMKSLPPAQRAQMEALMKKGGLAMAAVATTEYKRVGSDKAGKWSCDKYDGYQNGQKTSEVCAVDPKALGFTDAEFQVTQQLGEFMQKLMPRNADQLFSLGQSGAQGYNGVPVRRTYSILGRQTVSELTEVSRRTFADSSYAVPAGFEKQPFGMPGR